MITKYLAEKGSLVLKPEVRDEGRGYQMVDDGAVEVEVGEFLYGLVRLIKPKRVLTTGVYTGISDMYIAQGLKDNGYGLSQAIEFEKTHMDRAVDLWRRTDVKGQIEEHLMSSLNFDATGQYELMFLDTEPDIRFKELVKFFPSLAEGGFVFLHDLHHHLGQETIPGQVENWPWGKLPDEIAGWLQDGTLKPWYFPSPRGLTGFYKRRSGDYI